MANEKIVNVRKPKLPKLKRENNPRVIKERKPKIIKERKPKIIKEIKDKVIQEIKAKVIKEKTPKVIKEKEPEVIKEKEPKVIKEKEPKVAKEKKPKVVKEKKTKKEKEPMSKKKLVIMGILFILVLGSAAAGYYFMYKKEAPQQEERREPPMFEYFTLDDDNIESITNIVGYKVITDAYGKDIVFEPLNAEGEEEKKKEKKVKDETADVQVVAEEIPEEASVTYVYKDIKTASADVKEYVTYLMDNIGFEEVFPFYIDNPAGYISLSKDSTTDGFKIQLDIDYTKDGYTFILKKVEKPKEKKSRPKATISRNAALDVIMETPIEVLGLEESLDNLTLIGDPGHSTVDGMDCYGVRVYKTVDDNKSTIILGTYYIASDRETIYKYDVMSDVYTKIN